LPRSSTTFKPGQSGNPAGRAKGIEALARVHTAEALETLVNALRSPKERVPAAIALLDRGWGKPKQTVEGSVEVLSYVLRAPTPTESADEWLKLHAPSDSRALQTTDD
jgi:Family of unknown function (DUF5681)